MPSWLLPSQLVCPEILTAPQPLELRCHLAHHLVPITSVLFSESCCYVRLGLVSRSLGRARSDEHTILRVRLLLGLQGRHLERDPGVLWRVWLSGRGRGFGGSVLSGDCLTPSPSRECLPPVTCRFPVPQGLSGGMSSRHACLPCRMPAPLLTQPQRCQKGAGIPRLPSPGSTFVPWGLPAHPSHSVPHACPDTVTRWPARDAVAPWPL